MMHAQSAGVDLVCGPDSPLPEASHRYRLLQHLGSGGQAEVYRGVRLSAGVSSSPVTVKVFRADPARDVLDQIRSWDKGDAVLMDLNSRGVPGICLRVDGFYGLPPAPAGERVLSAERIPYQVLDYLPGGTLIDRLAGRGASQLRGAEVLATLADTLYALHHPDEPGDSPVLHMDVKPANVIVLPDDTVRLIDFTTARYDRAAHITTIAHTPQSAGPEAYTGAVGPAYDVHGFGSVAYYLVTGWLPRTDPAAGIPGGLRRHPLLTDHPALAAHLLAPLADRPEDRPRTTELGEWIVRLARLAAALPAGQRFVDWCLEPPAAARTRQLGARPQLVTPDEEPTDPIQLPATPAPEPTGVPQADATRVRTPRIAASAPVPPPTSVSRRSRFQDTTPDLAEPEPVSAPPSDPRRFRRGWRLTRFGAGVAAGGWCAWLATVLLQGGDTAPPLVGAVAVAAGAVLAYWLTRLAGHLLRSNLGRGPRRGTLVPHSVAAAFLVLSGVQFLSFTPLAPDRVYGYLVELGLL